MLGDCTYPEMINEHSEKTELCTCNGCHSKRLWKAKKVAAKEQRKHDKDEGFLTLLFAIIAGTGWRGTLRRNDISQQRDKVNFSVT